MYYSKKIILFFLIILVCIYAVLYIVLIFEKKNNLAEKKSRCIITKGQWNNEESVCECPYGSISYQFLYCGKCHENYKYENNKCILDYEIISKKYKNFDKNRKEWWGINYNPYGLEYTHGFDPYKNVLAL